MELKHTPGPWKLAHDRPMFGWWHVRQDPQKWDGQGYQAICTVPADKKGGYYGDMFAANAQLIAAAPDLLVAAQKAMAECCDLIATPAGDALQAAIAKAVGANT